LVAFDLQWRDQAQEGLAVSLGRAMLGQQAQVKLGLVLEAAVSLAALHLQAA
jgi:hypothetical protein